MDAGIKWHKLAAIQAGGAICLPIFIIGHALVEKQGEYPAYLSILIGNLFLLFLGILSALRAVDLRASSAELAALVFGAKGKIIFGLSMIVSMIGWFGIQLNMMGEAFSFIFPFVDAKLASFIFGIGITLLGVLGLKGLSRFANASVPFLALTILFAILNASPDTSKIQDLNFSYLENISLVIAASLAAVIDLPTFFKDAASKKDALLGTIALFGICLPLLEAAGAYLSAKGHGDNFLETLLVHSDLLSWKIWVSFFVLLAGWTTNNINLYSASISLKSLLPKASPFLSLLGLGFFGIAFSLVPFLTEVAVLLEIIGMILGSLGGIIISFLLGISPDSSGLRLKLVPLALGFGLLSFYKGPFLASPSLDALLFGFISSSIFSIKKIQPHFNFRRLYENR